MLATAQLSPTHEDLMVHAIQRAYYLDARNPSDISILVDLAIDIGLDSALFATELVCSDVLKRLDESIALARSAPINGFPSLVV